jgi:hypothetical protein
MSGSGTSRLSTRRPLVGVSLVFAGGCAAFSSGPVGLLSLFLLIPVALLATFLFRKTRWGLLSLYFSVLLAGGVYSTLYRATWLGPSASAQGPQAVELCGRVSGDPAVYEKKGELQTALTVFATDSRGGRSRSRAVFDGDLAE